MTVFWDAALLSLKDIHRRFRGTYGLHLEDDDSAKQHGATSQNTTIFKAIHLTIYNRNSDVSG
jgi:hypothetical protein